MIKSPIHYMGNKYQLLIPNKKVSFDWNTSSFNSSYFCSKMLDKQLKFVEIDNDNRGKIK